MLTLIFTIIPRNTIVSIFRQFFLQVPQLVQQAFLRAHNIKLVKTYKRRRHRRPVFPQITRIIRVIIPEIKCTGNDSLRGGANK